MYTPKHFSLFEIVPEDIYRDYHGSEILWWLFDDRILMAADLIRDRFGPMTINDWYYGGSNHFRGFRPADCGVGATLSQHKFGRALDLIPSDVSAHQIRAAIIEKDVAANLITCVEENIPWLHIDCRLPEAGGQIKIIYPRRT